MERGCGTKGKINAKKDPTKVSRRALHETYLNYFNEKNSPDPWVRVHRNPSYRRSLRQRRIERSYTGSDYKSRTTDFHVGYEGTEGSLDYYVQGGPALVNTDAVDGDTQLSAKAGASVNATDKLNVYGEVSVLTASGDVDNDWGTKIGAKYAF